MRGDGWIIKNRIECGGLQAALLHIISAVVSSILGTK